MLPGLAVALAVFVEAGLLFVETLLLGLPPPTLFFPSGRHLLHRSHALGVAAPLHTPLGRLTVEGRVQVEALLLGGLGLFDDDAVSLGPRVPTHPRHLPRDLHVRRAICRAVPTRLVM